MVSSQRIASKSKRGSEKRKGRNKRAQGVGGHVCITVALSLAHSAGYAGWWRRLVRMYSLPPLRPPQGEEARGPTAPLPPSHWDTYEEAGCPQQKDKHSGHSEIMT